MAETTFFRGGMKHAHPISCAAISRPVGKSGKRRELLPNPSEVACDCGAVSAEERIRMAREIDEKLVALRAGLVVSR